MLALFYPLIYMRYSQADTIFASTVVATVAVTIESIRFYSPKVEKIAEKIFSPIGKEEEAQRISGITYMTLGALFTVIFFPRVIAVPVLFFAVFGDAVSGLVALKWKQFKVFRNKSLEGTLACFAVCMAAGWFLLRTPLIVEGLNFNLILVMALLTTIFDIIPLPLDDNLSTPLAVGFLTQFLMY